MGTQKTVTIGEEPAVSGPVAEHHGRKKEKEKGRKEKIEEKIKEKKFEKEEEILEKPLEQEKKASAPAEGEEAKSAEAPERRREKVGKAKIRSKRYQEVVVLIDPIKKYEVAEAIDLVKKTSLTKFGGNVEVHLRMLAKTGKPESLRGFIQYPHPTGKKLEIIVLDEKVITEIEKTGKAAADIYLATPAIMPRVAKLAKILGPKGKMPNPKSGTITNNPEKTMKELSGGQVEYKTDSFGNIHQVIGKVSAEPKVLEENLKALLSALPVDRIVSINLCATMGPGVKVQI